MYTCKVIQKKGIRVFYFYNVGAQDNIKVTNHVEINVRLTATHPHT